MADTFVPVPNFTKYSGWTYGHWFLDSGGGQADLVADWEGIVPGGGGDPMAIDLMLDFADGLYKSQGDAETSDITTMDGYSYIRANAKAEWYAAGATNFAANVPGIVPGIGYYSREARTNYLLRSQQLESAVSWTFTQLTPASNVIVAPDGTTTADRYLEVGGAATTHRADQTQAKAASAIAVEGSVFVKGGLGRDWFRMILWDGTNGNSYWFDITNGVLGAAPTVLGTGFTGVSAEIVPCGSWYRCSIKGTTTTAATIVMRLQVSNVDGGNSYAGDITKGLYVWQAQVVASPGKAPIIPTITAQVTVGADNLSVDYVPPTSGTIFVSFYVPVAYLAQERVIGLEATNHPAMYIGSNYLAWTNGTDAWSVAPPVPWVQGALQRAAITWDSDTTRIAANGVTEVGQPKHLSAGNPVTALEVGAQDGGAFQLNGIVQEIWTDSKFRYEDQMVAITLGLPEPPDPTEDVYIGDDLSVVPVFAIAGVKTTAAQTRVARVQNAALAELDVVTADEADAFVAVKVVGFYNSVDDTLWSFTTPLDYVRFGDTIQAKNATGSAVSTPLPTGVRTAFGGVGRSGAAALVTYFNLPGSATIATLLLISSGTSTTAARDMLIRVNATPELECGCKRADADSASLQQHGAYYQGHEMIFANNNFASPAQRSGRYGSVSGFPANTLSATAPSTTTPMAASIQIPNNATFCNCVLFNSFLSAADEQKFALNAHQNFQDVYYISDGTQSWWSTVNGTSPVDPDLGFQGFTSRSGRIYMANINPNTGKLLDVYCTGVNLWLQDDHDSAAGVFMADGSLIWSECGHSNTAPGGTANDDTYRIYKSATGLVADSVLIQTIITPIVAANYQQWVRYGTIAVLFTNDDNDVTWRPIYCMDATVVTPVFSIGRRIVQQSSAPGGGTNQVYSLFDLLPSTTTVRVVPYPHSSNVQNKLYEGFLDIVTGALTIGGVEVVAAPGMYGDPAGTPMRQITSFSIIYTPPALKSIRLFNIEAMDTLIGEFTNSTGLDGVHKLLINNTPAAADLGNMGVGFQASPQNYYGGAAFSKRAHTGKEIFTVRENAGNWYFDRKNSADGGASWSTTNLRTVTDGEKLTRPFPVYGSGKYVFLSKGQYPTYQTWKLNFLPHDATTGEF